MKYSILRSHLICLVFFLGYAAFNSVWADSTSKRAIANEIVHYSKLGEMFSQTNKFISNGVSEAIRTRHKNLPPRGFEILRSEIERGFAAEIPLQINTAEITYTKNFSEIELSQILEFLNSPAWIKGFSGLYESILKKNFHNKTANDQKSDRQIVSKKLVDEIFKKLTVAEALNIKDFTRSPLFKKSMKIQKLAFKEGLNSGKMNTKPVLKAAMKRAIAQMKKEGISFP